MCNYILYLSHISVQRLANIPLLIDGLVIPDAIKGITLEMTLSLQEKLSFRASETSWNRVFSH